jgi:hypothetical protein
MKILNLEVELEVDEELHNLVVNVKVLYRAEVESAYDYFYEFLELELKRFNINPYQFMCQVSFNDLNLNDYIDVI